MDLEQGHPATLEYIHEVGAGSAAAGIVGGMATYSDSWSACGTGREGFAVKDKRAFVKRIYLSFDRPR